MSPKNFVVSVLPVSLAIMVVLTGACAARETATPEQQKPTQILDDITPQEAFTLIQENQNNPDFVTLDVRTPEEFADGHIEKATNIDFYAKTFRDELDKLDKSKTYLIYCRSGGRSGNTLNIMAELNFEEVYNVLGGILAWNAEELPTVK